MDFGKVNTIIAVMEELIMLKKQKTSSKKDNNLSDTQICVTSSIPKERGEFLNDLKHLQKQITTVIYKMQESLSNIIVRMNNQIDSLNMFNLPDIPYEEKMKKALNNMNLLRLSLEQKIIFKELCQELAGILPFNDYIIMGFIRMGMKKWQKDHNQPFFTLIRKNSIERIQVMSQIFSHAFPRMQRAIYLPDKEKKAEMFAEIFRIAIECYEDLISLQTFVNDPSLNDLNIVSDLLI